MQGRSLHLCEAERPRQEPFKAGFDECQPIVWRGQKEGRREAVPLVPDAHVDRIFRALLVDRDLQSNCRIFLIAPPVSCCSSYCFESIRRNLTLRWAECSQESSIVSWGSSY